LERLVIRFNYLAPSRASELGLLLGGLRDSSMRAPILAIAVSLLLLGTARALEDERLRVAQDRLQSVGIRQAAIVADRKRVQALTTDVGRLEKIDDYVRTVRRSGVERAEELAAIGNALPRHVWLTAIRDTDAGWAISGGARNVADVGTALVALERVPRVTSTVLVATQSGDRDERSIQYEMRLGRPR
jgi:hypothetical protein